MMAIRLTESCSATLVAKIEALVSSNIGSPREEHTLDGQRSMSEDSRMIWTEMRFVSQWIGQG